MRFLKILFLFFGLQHLNAQTTSHIFFWSRISTTYLVKEKWKTEVELQHRRQNDFSKNSINLFDKKLLNSFRTWLHYQHNQNLILSISPFSYFSHSSIITTENDLSSPTTKEIRIAASADYKHELLKNLSIINKTGIEFRYLQMNDNKIVRFRNKTGLKYIFNRKWNLNLYDEVFFNTISDKSTHFFDHNRLGFLINYKPLKCFRIESGYIFTLRPKKNEPSLYTENNFLVHLYYTFPNFNKNKRETQCNAS